MLPILNNSITNSMYTTINALREMLFDDEWGGENYLCDGNEESHEEINAQLNWEREFIDVDNHRKHMSNIDNSNVADNNNNNNDDDDEEHDEEDGESESESENENENESDDEVEQENIVDDATVIKYKEFHCCDNYCIQFIDDNDIKNLIKSVNASTKAMKRCTLFGMISAGVQKDDNNTETSKRKKRSRNAVNLNPDQELQPRTS